MICRSPSPKGKPEHYILHSFGSFGLACDQRIIRVYIFYRAKVLVTWLGTFFPSSARKFPVDSIVCPECQNVVKDYLHLNHIRDTQKWSDCEICGLILSESLKRNRIQEFHSKFENWERLECDYCTNGLKNDQLRACTNNRLFVCSVCNEGFFEIRNQILHIKRVHLKPTSVFIRGWFLSSWKMKSSKF